MPNEENENVPAEENQIQPAGDETPPAGDATPPADGSTEANAAPPTEGEPASGEQPAVGENFRHSMANGDDKKLARLERYASPQAVADALFAAQQKISSGEYQKPLSANPSEEEITEFREAKGIPQEAKDYEVKLPEGFVFGEEDQSRVERFKDKMHSTHATSEQVSAGLSIYAEFVEEEAVAQQQRDADDKEVFEDKMRSEYGDEYRANMNIVTNFIAGASPEIQEVIAHSRGPNGQALLNNPEYVRWLTATARELNPAASVVRKAGTDNMKSIDDELDILSKEMSADIDKWHKDPDKKKRHRILLEAKSKLEKRSA